MATNQPNNNEQDVDLSRISRKIGGVLTNSIFEAILFLKRNSIVLLVLFIIGLAGGIYLDQSKKIYDHQIIVMPNYGSVDYLYSKVELLNSKIKEGDTVFLKGIGIQNPKKLLKIEIKPLSDIYRLVNNNDKNFELLKLMAEDGSMSKVLEESPTSKNYTYHSITFSTAGKTDKEKTVQPLLDYFNNTAYYKMLRDQYLKNIKIKMQANEVIIAQIDAILGEFSSTNAKGAKNDHLVFINENTQMNDIIETKQDLLVEQGRYRIETLNLQKVVKDSSVTLNNKNTKLTNGKLKVIIPIVLIGIFIFLSLTISFYKAQVEKRKNLG